MVIKNYSSLSKLAKSKVKKAGYNPDASGKTASRKSNASKSNKSSNIDKYGSSSTAQQMAAAQAQIKQNWANKQASNPAYQAQMPVYKAQEQGFSAWTPQSAPAQETGFFDGIKQRWQTAQDKAMSANYTENPPVGGIAGHGALTLGFAGLVKGASSAIAKITGKTAVSQAAKVGLANTATKTGKITTASTFATNSKNIKTTKSWLGKIAKAAKKPSVIVSAIIASIGSYPFAGFIKEEALQTLGFGVKSALDNGDIEGAAMAIEQQKSILDPGVWDEIKNGIPFVNVLNNLDKFYQAAQTKLKIDEKVVSDMQQQQATGMSDDERWAQAREEQAAQERAMVDYYNNKRKQMLEWEREAAIQARNEDARFWAAEQDKQRKKEAEDRKAMADFWLEYRKTMLKLSDDNRPSNLKFGLL